MRTALKIVGVLAIVIVALNLIGRQAERTVENQRDADKLAKAAHELSVFGERVRQAP